MPGLGLGWQPSGATRALADPGDRVRPAWIAARLQQQYSVGGGEKGKGNKQKEPLFP